MFIIIKTNSKTSISQLVSCHIERCQACEKLSELVDDKLDNKVKKNGVIKCYDKGYIYNSVSYLYQLIEIETKTN